MFINNLFFINFNIKIMLQVVKYNTLIRRVCKFIKIIKHTL